MSVSGSSYPPTPGGYNSKPLINLNTGGYELSGKPANLTPASVNLDDPSARNGATLQMMSDWQPINIVVGGTRLIKHYAEDIIPREPREDDDAYSRRLFHAVLPPFTQRLASQATGTILRKGIHLEGGDLEYWEEWAKDVTGDGTTLNEFCRTVLVDALLYGHSSVLVDFASGETPATLRDELAENRQPYLVRVSAQQIRGWRTENNRRQGELRQVRFSEAVSIPEGQFGEEVVEQIRVLYPGRYELYRDQYPNNQNEGWRLVESGDISLDEIPLVTVYSNRIGTLTSKPPLLEVANLNISYCQRYCDYHHTIHVGSQPILLLKGFDPDDSTDLGLSINTAVLLPPEGDGKYIEPTSDAYDSQLQCLQTLEQQISQLGISTLAQQNITNAAAESKRLDRIDSDSIMAIISEDLTRAVTDIMRMAGKYIDREPPKVTIPKDYENRLLDGNQITAMLQLQMQNQISQETLLRILQEGEVLPPYINVDDEITKTRDEMEEQFKDQLAQTEAMMDMEPEQQGGVTTGNAANGSQSGSQTLPTPLRKGKDE